ncbi:MAG: Plug domain-containing protein, partial [Bacteroidales bacterium]|nr:Plug domain-containing protein [Bacteroidales bacterium]
MKRLLFVLPVFCAVTVMAQEKPEPGPIETSASVVRIDGKAFEGRPITNVAQGLQGLVPGLTVIGADGAPGQDGGTILIHGAGSLNGTSPYVLVDGVETWSLNTVDPSDVES